MVFPVSIQGLAKSVNRLGEKARGARESRNIAKSSKSLDAGDVGRLLAKREAARGRNRWGGSTDTS
jgi:hypothetical protein